MKNDILSISQKIISYTSDLFPLSGEDIELEIIHAIADELLKDMGEIEQYDNVKKALVNMFIVGQLSNKKSNG